MEHKADRIRPVKYWEIIVDNLKESRIEFELGLSARSRGASNMDCLTQAATLESNSLRVRMENLKAFLELEISDWLVRQIKMILESLQRTNHVLFWFSNGLPVFGALLGAGAGVARYHVDRRVLAGYTTALKRWPIIQKSLGQALKNVGLACGGCLPCQNDNKSFISEHS